ncbi:MAG TPA: DUF222 domain-containing protein, partial [Acidimicrobiales bacterium]
DPAVLADPDSLVALHRQLDRLEAVAARADASFDNSGVWQADGAHSAAAWISTRCHHPKAVADRRVRQGRQLRDMPVVERAWLAGDLSSAHVGLLGQARTDMTAETFARDEQMLCDQALKLRFHQFVNVVKYWRYRADPDGAEDDAKKLKDSRRFHLSKSFEGQYLSDGMFDPIGGAVFAKTLREIEDELFEDDWAEAKERLGREPKVTDLSRTPAQRRADAVVEMARRARGVPPGARLPEPLFTVLVGYETFAGPICQLANGSVVTPGSLVPYLDDSWIERVVFGSPGRVLDVGVRRRLFDGATRRAVEVAGQNCFHDYCDTPAEDCQIDHIQPWAAGGPTTQENGRPACPYHNRGRHKPRPPPAE